MGPGSGAGMGRFVGPSTVGVAAALGPAGGVSVSGGVVRLKLSWGPKTSAGCCDCGVGDGGGDGEPPRGERANGSVGAGLGSAGRGMEAWTGVFWGVFWGVSPWAASRGMEIDVRVGTRACAIASMSDISGISFVSPASVSPVGVLVSGLGMYSFTGGGLLKRFLLDFLVSAAAAGPFVRARRAVVETLLEGSLVESSKGSSGDMWLAGGLGLWERGGGDGSFVVFPAGFMAWGGARFPFGKADGRVFVHRVKHVRLGLF